MSQCRYMISEAAKKVDVETHVLRYWEEELEIQISRTELGHRYYTEEDIEIFQKVKKLKERGLQLKAIKLLVPELRKKSETSQTKEVSVSENIIRLEEKLNQRLQGAGQEKEENLAQTEKAEILPKVEEVPDKLQQLETVFGGVLTRVIQDNNVELERRITDRISQEMEMLLKVREEREEERFRALDETIRTHQNKRCYVAAAKERNTRKKRKFKLF